jgi:Cytidylate kinase-like family
MGQVPASLDKVVTVSARYGAAGSVIAPKLAARLGLRFFDRLIHGAGTANVESIVERLTVEEEQQAPPGPIVTGLTRMGAALGLPTPAQGDVDMGGELRARVEASVAQISRTGGGVILGRAAAVVLAAHPMSFNVRLAGPADRCLAQGMSIEGVSEAVAREHQERADRSWARFVSRLFDRDPTDPRLYHLMVDSTVIPIDACVELIAGAASAFWERAASSGVLPP